MIATIPDHVTDNDEKCLGLARELRKLRNRKVTVIANLYQASRTIPKNFLKIRIEPIQTTMLKALT